MDTKTPQPDEVREALSRMLKSRAFAKKTTQKPLLSFLVECALQGKEVNESILLSKFFSRELGPHDDGIVRSNMNNLRTAINDYYDIEGASEEVRIVVPRRTYNPSIYYSTLTRERAELDRREEELRLREEQIRQQQAEFDRKVKEVEARWDQRDAQERIARNDASEKLQEMRQKISDLELKLMESETEAKKRELRLISDAVEREKRILKEVESSARSVVNALADDCPF